MTIYFSIVFGFYFLFLACLLIGWTAASRQTKATAVDRKFISVVVAMRNERTNVGTLLSSLSSLDYPSDFFEIILVDDHSEDGTEEEARKWAKQIPSLKIITLDENENGKKACLSKAIGIANGDVIATTDADCAVPPNWLKRINAAFRPTTTMCIGVVALQNGSTLFSKLQSIEFASVMSTGVSMAVMGRPIMCNGANLSFRKKIFSQVGGYQGNAHIASGDDEFLLRKINDAYPNSIAVVADCVVVTKPQSTLKDFIHQRTRWASKWKHNSSAFARFLAVFVFATQLSWLALMALVAFYSSPFFWGLITVKVLLDCIVLFTASRALDMKFGWVAFIALQFLYPFYVFYVGLFAQRKDHLWKGRKI